MTIELIELKLDRGREHCASTELSLSSTTDTLKNCIQKKQQQNKTKQNKTKQNVRTKSIISIDYMWLSRAFKQSGYKVVPFIFG